MVILGFNGSLNSINDNRFLVNKGEFHDAGAVLLTNGRITSCFEEERLNRIKHTNKFPVLSIGKCLETAGIDFEDVDYFALPTAEEIMDRGLFFYYKRGLLPEPLGAREFMVQKFRDEFGVDVAKDKFLFFHHHHAHAATAYYQSGYDNALVATLDGEGDELSASVYDADGNDLNNLDKIPAENSLGKLYLAVTEHIGYKLFDEYKVMGLASYGNPHAFDKEFQKAYKLLENGKYQLDLRKLQLVLGAIVKKNEGHEFLQIHKDLAASLQYTLEKIVLHILTHYKAKTGRENLCMAGGVALNCSLNKVLLYKGLFRNIYVSPVSSDSGLPLGAAFLGYKEKASSPVFNQFENIYLGTNNTKGTIEAELKNWEQLITYEYDKHITDRAANLLHEGKVLGWFQGAAEFGPRALGNRSIIADPRPVENRDRINQIIKMRETYRPFAPSVIEEAVDDFFVTSDVSKAAFSYMTFTLGVKEEYQSLLGAISHIDGTARVQTVNREQNEKYWKLIKRFGELTEVPIVLNTSFNNNYEPIVDTPHDAITCFLTSDIDHLIIDNYLISKRVNPAEMDFLKCMDISLPAFIKASDLNGKGHCLTNTFNEWETPISEDIYRLLTPEVGQLNGNPANSQLISKELKSTLYELWQKRLVKITNKTSIN